MSLHIYTGNRMEKLVSALADVVKAPLAEPLAREVIVVQSKGMQRWVAMELAGRLGVWANCDYPFPNAMVLRLFRLVFPEIPEETVFSREALTWKMMGLLPEFLDVPDFIAIRRYLDHDQDGLKLFQLARRIANTFDQYCLFRPQMLKTWEASQETDMESKWQAVLWRAIVSGAGERHRGALHEDFILQMTGDLSAAIKMPQRISVFGISYLPQYHMEILAALIPFSEIHLFLLSPTREYWSDIVSRRQKARLSPQSSALANEGNPLLASLGRLGRDFSDMVIAIGDAATEEWDLYEEPALDSLLHGLQSDILNLSGELDQDAKRPVEPGDFSLQIHSCHSPMREVEVLHDHLLALFEQMEGLLPGDIVVMTPDIEIYAPYIAAVFDGQPDASRKIPYSIADRRLKSEGRIASVFLKLFKLPGNRLSALQLFDLLSEGPVQKRFYLEPDELQRIRGWIEDTGVRWGLDEQSRIDRGLPGYQENTWQAGMERLFLGYAMSACEEKLFQNILPYDDLEGAGAQTLGKLAEFISKIEDIADFSNKARTPGQWVLACRKLLADFIAVSDDEAFELAVVNEIINEIESISQMTGFDRQVSFPVIRAWLTERLEQEEKGYGFLTGGVTFCALLPMRSVPFRVVALLGMNEGAFPRQDFSPGFDLIAKNPRRGDRSQRDEDRYMFLESLLSARDVFYISYVGQSARDLSQMPPSVLVSELLDAIERSFTAGPDKKMETRLVTKHRLQAFSPEYFSGDSPLFSYSEENCRAVLEKQSHPDISGVFLSKPHEISPGESQEISLVGLLRFFDNPAKYLLENKMGMRMEKLVEPLQEREPFSCEGLEYYLLKQELLDRCLRGLDATGYLGAARNRGEIPPARHGEIVFDKAGREIQKLAQKILDWQAGRASLADLDVELKIGNWTLTGRLGGIWPDRMLRYRPAKVKAKDRLHAWIEHLVLSVSGRQNDPRQTLLLMQDGAFVYSEVENAQTYLQILLALYEQGLTQPLVFFPESSLEYARTKDAVKARQVWAGNSFQQIPGEGDDASIRLCFGRKEPFSEEFARTAGVVYDALLRHEGKLSP